MDAPSSAGVARACEALERAMRRLTDEIATVRKPPVVHACDDDDDAAADDDDGRRRRAAADDDDDDDVDSIDALTATLVARTAGAMEVDDAPASASALASALWTDVEREDWTERLDGRRRRRRIPDDKDAVIRTLEGRCERLESTVWTLRDALEAKRRDVVGSSSDGVAREVLAKEVMTLRRRLTAVNADRERLIELSNELRAALVRRMQSETLASSSSDEARLTGEIGAAPRVVVEATPVVIVTRRDGDAGPTTTMAPSSSERETESQKIRLKRAIMRAKERRAAPRVRNWNDVSL